MSFVISTDTSANLPTAELQWHQLYLLPFSYIVNEVEHQCLDLSAFDGDAYYEMLRHTPASTSMISMDQYRQLWEPLLEEGHDILHVGMSSGISGSYASSKIAANQLAEEFPERKILTVDTYSASLAEGIVVMRAVADAGGHADEQNVLSVFQHRADVVDKALRRNLRGCDLFAVSHRGVKCLGVERGGVHARLLAGFGVEGEGNHGDILCLQICGREIGGSIGHDAKHNNRFFLLEFVSDALHKIITFSKLCQPIYIHRLSCICVKKLL